MKIPLTILLTTGIIFLFFISYSYSSVDYYPAGSRQAGMANSSVTLSDLWCVYHNQAGLANLTRLSAGVHHENKFLVKEYGLQALAIALPVKNGVFGLSVSYFGYSKYNEIKAGLAFARSFGKGFSAAVQIDYCNTFVSGEYGNKGIAVIEAGILSEPLENLHIGAHIYNPTHQRISEYDELIPTIFRFGVSYNFFNKITLAVENEKDIEMSPMFKIGLEYHMINYFYLRTGISTNPSLTTFGLGYVIKHAKADIAFSYHQILGLSPHFTLSYEF